METLQLPAQCAVPSAGVTNVLVSTLIQALLAAQCAISPVSDWPTDYADIALSQGLQDYDFVVIGAGSAGSVVASRLSENPDWSVLVLEAGDNPPQESEIPPLLFTYQHTNFTWNYFTEPNDNHCRAMRNKQCYWPRGKMIGGSGAANAMLYIRGNRQDYDTWAHMGNTHWGYDDVLPYFEKSVRAVGTAERPQGYVSVNPFELQDVPVQNMIYAGAKELGVPRVPEFREGYEIGYTNVPGTVRNGHRTTTGKGHLGRVDGRKNLHVIKNAHVQKLNFDESGKRVESISFKLQGQHSMSVRVKKEAVLSAGTIDSPKLLMLSGVGPKQQLEHLQIPVKHDLPIGNNLQDHVLIPIFIKLDEGSAEPVNPVDVLDGIYNYLMHSTGALATHGTISLTAFLNTLANSTSPYPDIENHHFYFQRGNFQGLSSLLYGLSFDAEYMESLRKVLLESNLLVIANVLSHPQSIGQLRLRSAAPDDPPLIYANYMAEEADIATLLNGIAYIERLVQTKAFKAHHADIVHVPIRECDAHAFRSESYWRCYMRYFSMTLYHHVGTVKMGADTDPTACVNSELRLRGVQNVRVADASIMPAIPSSNTNAATIMIAERAADFIRNSWLSNQLPQDEL